MVSSVVPQPALPSVHDDQKIKDYVHSFLSQFLSQSGILPANPSLSAPSVVPHSFPLLRGTTESGGAASLNRGRPTEASVKVPEDQIPPSCDLHAFDVGRDFVGSDVRSPFSALGLRPLAVGSSMNQLGWHDESHSVSSDQVNVTCVGSSSMFNLASLLFPLSDSGFASFPPSASSLGLSSSSSSSSFGFSTVAPSLPPSSLPAFSLSSVVPSVLAVSSSAPTLASVPVAFPPGSPPAVSFSSGISSSFLPPSAPLFPFAPLSAPSVLSSLPPPSSSSFFSSPSFFSSSSSVSSSASASGDFTSAQAHMLGLSAEYQAVGHWFVQFGGSDFLSLSFCAFSSSFL